MEVIKAYAKINLRLKIVGKLKNGYHKLEMINAKTSLYDEITISNDITNSVTYSIDELNHLEKNMCLDILNELTSRAKDKQYFSVYIEKRIPMGAGLGGGSSDAAALINYLNAKLFLGMTFEDKIELGLKYGADIPYCLRNDLCYVEGIGEIITPFNVSLKGTKVCIIYPNIHNSTEEIFKAAKHVVYANTYNRYKRELEIDFERLLENDLEEIAFKKNKELKKLKEFISEYGKCVMSGSGSAFLLFCSEETCELLKKKYPNYLIEMTTIL